MRRFLFCVGLPLCLWVNPAFSQQPTPLPATQSITLDIKVVDIASATIEEIERIARDKNRLSQMLADGRAKITASTQVVTLSDHTNSLHLGQRVPIQRTGGPASQIEYENTGLSLDVRPRLVKDNLVEVQFKLDFSGVVGETLPAFIQRSISTTVLLKADEPAMVLGFTQNETLWPKGTEADQKSNGQQKNFFLLVSAKMTN
jgi:type II secretory pathway component HofQ